MDTVRFAFQINKYIFDALRFGVDDQSLFQKIRLQSRLVEFAVELDSSRNAPPFTFAPRVLFRLAGQA